MELLGLNNAEVASYPNIPGEAKCFGEIDYGMPWSQLIALKILSIPIRMIKPFGRRRWGVDGLSRASLPCAGMKVVATPWVTLATPSIEKRTAME